MNRKTITDYLEETARNYPDKTAFTDEKREITFREVREEAQKTASALLSMNLTKKPVAIFMDKCVECINAFLGVAYSGNFYTVIDIHMPAARIEKILETLQPEAIITDDSHYSEAAKIAGSIQILTYGQMMSHPVDGELLKKASDRMVQTDILYVLFTSGSTGTPKGVIISHEAVIAYLEWGAGTFPLDENTVFANQTPFYFVMSGFDIYQTIRNGSTMHIIPKRFFMFPLKLLEFLRDRKVNTLYWVPSVLCFIANFGALPKIHLDDLHTIMFSGEVMPSKHLNMWRNEYPDALFVNHYGPTEMTDICTYYTVDREIADNESLPIGIPCSHMDILLLDENDRPVKPGETGELCGRGPSLAYGYYNDPEKTAAAFVQNPLNTSYPEKIYRTGDLVRLNDRGELVYVSRKDFQIKHMGHRIELGEIETAVSALEGVEMNCCLYAGEESGIVLFYTGSMDGTEMLRQLKLSLPNYMLPNRRIRLEQMPLNLNGKIDRARLRGLIPSQAP